MRATSSRQVSVSLAWKIHDWLQEKVIPAIFSHAPKDGEAFERAQDKFRGVYLSWLNDVRQGLFPKEKMSGWYKNFEFGMDAFAALGVCLAQVTTALLQIGYIFQQWEVFY